MTAMIIPLAEEAIARRIKRLYDAVYTIESCFGVEISAHKELLPTQYIDAPALAYRMAQVGRLEAATAWSC